MKKGNKIVLIAGAVIAMLAAGSASRYQNTPQAQLLRYLKQADYTVIQPVRVQCGFDKNGTAATAAEIRFEFSISERDLTDALIHDVFKARAQVERYMDENAEHFPDPYVRCVFEDAHDASATVITVANYADKNHYFAGYRADDPFQLDCGVFDAEYGAASSFADAPAFTVLMLRSFDECDLSALEAQSGLQKLALERCTDPGESAQNFLRTHPDCALSVNGETVRISTTEQENEHDGQTVYAGGSPGND